MHYRLAIAHAALHVYTLRVVINSAVYVQAIRLTVHRSFCHKTIRTFFSLASM